MHSHAFGFSYLELGKRFGCAVGNNRTIVCSLVMCANDARAANELCKQVKLTSAIETEATASRLYFLFAIDKRLFYPQNSHWNASAEAVGAHSTWLTSLAAMRSCSAHLLHACFVCVCCL